MSQQADLSSPYAAMLPDYLTAMAEKLYAANKQRRQAITSAEQWQARQKELREYFASALGGFPDRTPLNAKVCGTIDSGPFIIEKTILQSHPNFLVTASLYVPKDLAGRAPAVLVPCGHSANGRMYELYQAVGIAMALNGFVALVYDPISQGERVQYYDESIGDSTVGPCTSEHSQMDNQCDLIGHNIAKYRIHDGMRCLDYLQSRSEVDGERLGCTGCSGGGTLTTYLMALDDRIKAAAPVCYLTSLQARQESDMIADGEQNIFGQLACGMDHHEMAAMTAPRALRLCAAEEDYFPLHGAQETAEFCRQIYELLGVADRFELFVGAGPHGFSAEIRNAAVEWLGRFLDMPTSDVDPDRYILPEEQLYCTDTGQVVTSTDSRKVYEVNLEVFEKQRADLTTARPREELRKTVAAVLEITAPVAIIKQKAFDPASMGLEADAETDYRLIATDAGLYAGLFTKKSGADGKAVRLVVMDEPAMAIRACFANGLELDSMGAAAEASEDEVVTKVLTVANVRLVLSIAREYEGRCSMSLADMAQEGYRGLLRAVERFDPSNGEKFSTYATWWIRQHITRAIADQSRILYTRKDVGPGTEDTARQEALALLSVCGTGISDLRRHGKGDLEDRPGNSARLLGREAFAAYSAEIMGFSLLRLRVRDILAAIGFLRDEGGYDDIVLEGHGRAGIWALHAAVLDGGLAGVKLQDTLWSYELMIRDGEYTVPHMADIARGCLLHYDLPQLCAALAARPLEIVNPVDSRGGAFDARNTPQFAIIREAYGDAADNLRIS